MTQTLAVAAVVAADSNRHAVTGLHLRPTVVAAAVAVGCGHSRGLPGQLLAYRHDGAASGELDFYLIPVVALLVRVGLTHEHLAPPQILGTQIVLRALAPNTGAHRRAERPITGVPAAATD